MPNPILEGLTPCSECDYCLWDQDRIPIGYEDYYCDYYGKSLQDFVKEDPCPGYFEDLEDEDDELLGGDRPEFYCYVCNDLTEEVCCVCDELVCEKHRVSMNKGKFICNNCAKFLDKERDPCYVCGYEAFDNCEQCGRPACKDHSILLSVVPDKEFLCRSCEERLISKMFEDSSFAETSLGKQIMEILSVKSLIDF